MIILKLASQVVVTVSLCLFVERSLLNLIFERYSSLVLRMVSGS